jgi:hypothetical protein
MSTPTARIAAAAVALLAAPLALSACAAPASTVSNDELAAQIADGVRAADPAIADVAVQSTDGVAGRTVWVRLYVDLDDEPDLASMVDAALPAILASSPVRPVGFYLDVHEAPAPATVDFRSRSGLDLTEAARELGIYDWYSDRVLGASIADLEARTGSWDELRG